MGSEWPLNCFSHVPLLSLAIWSWGLEREQVLAPSCQFHSMGQCYRVIKKQWGFFSSFLEESANSIRVEVLPATFLL